MLREISRKELYKIIERHKLWLSTNGTEGERANLSYANLSYANLDFSCFPLWCGGLDVHIDDKQASQLLYHLIKNINFSKNTSAKLKRLCKIKTLIKQANEFHRVNECGKIEVTENESSFNEHKT